MFLFIFLISCKGNTQTNSELMNCWIESYNLDFKFIEQLDDLEKQLLTQKVIDGTGVEDYKSLFKEISEGTRKLNLDKLTVNHYVNESRFKDCASKSELPNENSQTFKYGVLFSIYHILSEGIFRIKVDLHSDERIAINDEFYTIDGFTERMALEIDNLVRNGVPENEVAILLKVDPQTKMKFVTKVQEKLKELKVKKIFYSHWK